MNADDPLWNLAHRALAVVFIHVMIPPRRQPPRCDALCFEVPPSYIVRLTCLHADTLAGGGADAPHSRTHCSAGGLKFPFSLLPVTHTMQVTVLHFELQEVGLTDRIFTRIATREAASVPRSAFMIDLSQMASMLRLSTSRYARS